MTVATAPGAWPVIGHGRQLWSRPLEFVTAMNGMGPLVRFQPGPTPCYMVTDPELLHRVLVTGARDFSKGRVTDAWGPQIGVNLLMDMDFDGMNLFQSHRCHRRAIQPAFHPSRIAAQTPAVVRITKEHTATWQPGKAMRLEHELSALADHLSAHAMCADHAPAVAAPLARFREQLTPNNYWRTVAPRWTDSLPVPGFLRARHRLLTAIGLALQARRRHPECDEGDVLSRLCHARHPDTDTPLDDVQISREVLFYLFAGAHGVGGVLPWLFQELAHHPQAEARVHHEVDMVLGGREVRPDDLPRLTFTRQVVLEVLRLHPPVWMLARRTNTRMELGGRQLPQGADLAFSPYAIHRHPGFHSDPDAFDPDRWCPARARKLPSCAYVPFSMGPRKCIGDRLVMNQMLTVVSTIAARWRLRPVPGAEARPHARIFLEPKDVLMVCEPRNAPAAEASEPGPRESKGHDRLR